MGWKATFNFQWHEGRGDAQKDKGKDKREINQNLILAFVQALRLEIKYNSEH